MWHRLLSCVGLVCLAAVNSFGQTAFSNTNAITLSSTQSLTSVLDSSAITSSGLSGKIGKLTVTLNNWTENTDGGGNLDRAFFLAYTPTGSSTTYTYEFLAAFGSFTGLTNVTVTLDDTSGNGRAPTETAVGSGTHTYQSDVPSNSFYATDPGTGLASGNTNFAGPDGTASFGSVFNGLAPNGTWTLYIFDHEGGDNAAGIAGGWTVTLTTAVEDGTTTSLTPSTTETFESVNVTFHAQVGDSTNSGTQVSSGSVVFKDLLTGNTLGTMPVSAGSASLTTSFSSEGNHTIQASYSDSSSTFGPSSMTAAVFIDHPTTATSPTFCNAGTLSIDTTAGGAAGAIPYPQHIFPSSLTGSLTGLSLTLNNLQNVFLADLNVLLVGPSGNSKFVALAGVGPSGAPVTNGINLALSDFGSGTVPAGGVGSGPYLPTDLNTSLTFGAAAPAGPYSLPQSQGSATFATTFAVESNLNGMWSIYVFDHVGGDTSSIGGSCLTFTTSAIASTSTSLTAAPPTATVGQTVDFTATVTSGGSPVTAGTVTFKENGTILSGPTAVDSSGKVVYFNNSLSEGVHDISAVYSGVAGTYNVSSATTSIEVDTATTVTGASYCNPGGITTIANGHSSPYPSRINVTGLAGTVNSVTISIDNFTNSLPAEAQMLLVGPSATNLDFFQDAGLANAVSGLKFTFSDAASSYVPSAITSGTFKPTVNSEAGNTFPAPAAAAITYSGPVGAGTLAASFATSNFNGNGYWSLFTLGAGGETGSMGKWCVNFTENPPVLALSNAHAAAFTQGDTNDVYTITVSNNGPGATGGTLTLADTLPTGLTPANMGQTSGGTGSDWSCTVATATCTRTTPMPAGEADVITLEVGVGLSTATGTNSITNSVSVSGGGAATVTATDPTTIVPGTVQVTFNISPAGLSYSVDGTTYTASQMLSLANGSLHTIATTSEQDSTGTHNAFASWSDVGGASHQITISSAVTSYTATFNTSYLLTTSGSPAADGTVTPTSGSYYSSGSVVNLIATPNTGFNFQSWTGGAANANSASTTITMSAPRAVTANFVVNNTSVTINTSPQGLLVSVDGGVAQNAPASISWQVGTQHTIATTSPQGSNGTHYAFSAWSDSGAISHTVTASTTTPSYTATFTTSYLLTTSASPPAGGTVTPPSGSYFSSGAVVNLMASPNPGSLFTDWTGNVANANSLATTVTMTGPQTVVANFSGPSATFVPLDTTTQGNWVGTYGQDGYTIASDTSSLPAYATVAFNGASTYIWVQSSTDPRALLKNPSTTDRIASTFYSTTTFTIDVNLADSLTHQVALYLLDLDTFSRVETIAIVDANTNNVLDSRSFSNFHNGEYAVWNLTGHVLIQVTGNAGLNAAVSGLFFNTITPPAGPSVSITAPTASQSISGNFAFTANATAPTGIASVQFVVDNVNLGAPVTGAEPAYSLSVATATISTGPHSLKAVATDNLAQTMTSATVSFTVSNPGVPPASAVFVPPADTATQGNWVNKYGADGYVISSDAIRLPVYATVNFSGATQYVWAASSTDPRALLASPSGANRIASTYYSATSFTIDVNLVDNQPHQVALYCLDFDDNRAETISILDANSSTVLDTETVANFQNGQYLVWNMQGHVKIQLIRTGGLNAVVSALLFATVPPTPPPAPTVSLTAPTPSQTVAGTFTVQASATSSGGTIAAVQFVLDGTTNIGPPITAGTAGVYSYRWPSTTVGNGPHTLAAIAIDNLSQKTTSASVSFAVQNAAQTNSAAFVGLDTITQGNWQGKYGTDGEIIASDSNVSPSYAVVGFTGGSQFAWATTTDQRALLMAGSSTNRIASAFYNSPGFTIDVNFTDGNAHQIALYLVDWDNSGRAETINILDASNNNSLDSRPATNFQSGKYLVWNVKGHVVIQVNSTAGPNAIVSGVFFEPGS